MAHRNCTLPGQGAVAKASKGTTRSIFATCRACLEHKPDSLGIPLAPVTYEVTAGIARAERWDLTREALRRLW